MVEEYPEYPCGGFLKWRGLPQNERLNNGKSYNLDDLGACLNDLLDPVAGSSPKL